jgi:hypothetical protein
MLGLDNIERRLGISAITDRGLSKMQFTDIYGNPTGNPLNVRCKDASDFCLELPFSLSEPYTDDMIVGLDLSDEIRVMPNDREALNATMDAIDEICNLNGDFAIEIDNTILKE